MTKYSLTHKGILVIGAGGFVGQLLADTLFGRAKPRRRDGDLSDSAYCRRILRGARTVYYLAGLKKNSLHHEREPYTFAAGNVRPLLVFLDCLRGGRVKKFIFLSSTVVDYPGTADGYVVGKRTCELILETFAAEFPQTDVKIIRPALIYGPGNNFDPASANFIAAQIAKVARARGEVEVWGTGKRRMQFIYIDDLIKNLLAAEKSQKKFFVFGNPESASVNEVVKKIVQIYGKHIRLRNNPRQPDKPTKILKFNNIIKPRVTLAEGLQRTIELYRKTI